MYYADDIKRAVTMQEVAELYGLEVNRAGFARCPFHHEKTASFKVYPGDRGFHCFGCGRSGDVISFVQEMDGSSFQEACEKLNRAFSLGLPIGERIPRRRATEDARKAFMRRREMQAQKDEETRAEEEYWAAYDAWLENQRTIEATAPKTPAEPFSAAFAEAVSRQPLLEFKLEQADINRGEKRRKY